MRQGAVLAQRLAKEKSTDSANSPNSSEFVLRTTVWGEIRLERRSASGQTRSLPKACWGPASHPERTSRPNTPNQPASTRTPALRRLFPLPDPAVEVIVHGRHQFLDLAVEEVVRALDH